MTWKDELKAAVFWVLLSLAIVLVVAGLTRGQEMPDPTAPILRDDSGLWSPPDGVAIVEQPEPAEPPDGFWAAVWDVWILFTIQWGVD